VNVLLVPAHPGFPGQIPQSRKTVVVVVVVVGYRSLQFFTVLNSVCGRLFAEGPPNSIVNRFKIGAVWGPHVRLDEINLLFL